MRKRAKIAFNPKYIISKNIMGNILKIEQLKEKYNNLSVKPSLINVLSSNIKITSTYYSCKIEGYKPDAEDLAQVLKNKKELPNKDIEKKIKGYYKALKYIEKIVLKNKVITEKEIKKIHSIIDDNLEISYRKNEDMVTDTTTGEIIYIPLSAKDIPPMINDLLNWIEEDSETHPIIKAGIAFFHYLTIHPYDKGNNTCARLLASLILQKTGYGMHGLYSIEEYFATDLNRYFDAMVLGLKHDYYMERAEADITPWLEYFTQGIRECFEKGFKSIRQEVTIKDLSPYLRELDARQKKILELFEIQKIVTTNDIATFFHLTPRTARNITQDWTKNGFLIMVDEAKKSRKYQLNKKLEDIFRNEY